MLEQFETCTPVLALFRPWLSARSVMPRLFPALTGETAGHRFGLGEVSGGYGTSEAGKLCLQEKPGGVFLC